MGCLTQQLLIRLSCLVNDPQELTNLAEKTKCTFNGTLGQGGGGCFSGNIYFWRSLGKKWSAPGLGTDSFVNERLMKFIKLLTKPH